MKLWIGASVLVLVAIVGFTGWYRLLREESQTFDNPEEQFKYGSIGVENDQGIPYRIWQVLPDVFPQYLPHGRGEGYEAFGLVTEPGHTTPVGIPKKVIGFERVGINCGLCHTGTFRTDAQDPPTIVATAPTTRLDIQSYFRFFFQAAADPRFTADSLLPAMRRYGPLDPIDEVLYRFIIIPATRDGLLKQRDGFDWTDSRPNWGPGRIDPFNPVKFNQLQIDPNGDTTVGNSDMEPLWNLQPGYGLHWDGLNDSVAEVALTGALGDGASKDSLPVTGVMRMIEWASGVQPPKYPYPVDPELAARGEPIYQQKCASCHAFGGQRTGTVVPQAEVKTDIHRLEMWSQEAATRYNAYAADRPYRFNRFVKTDGYVSVPLDGIWLRAPYLHNGSVPTMEDLLEPAANRPTSFYRGYDVYDRDRMGFVHTGTEAEQLGWRYDTSVVGNGNAGHEGDAYGTTLSAADKKALIEYLKTL